MMSIKTGLLMLQELTKIFELPKYTRRLTLDFEVNEAAKATIEYYPDIGEAEIKSFKTIVKKFELKEVKEDKPKGE